MIRLMVILVAVGAIAAGAYLYGPGVWARWAESGSDVPDVPARFHTVVSRPLVIDFVAKGELAARGYHSVDFKLKSMTQATILSVVEQGAEVKKGDSLIRLDPQPIVEKIKLKEKELKAAKENVPLKESWLDVERSIAQSLITGAQETMQKSIDGLKKFRQWDAPNEFKKLDDQIAAAIEAREKAFKAYRDAKAAADAVSFGDDDKRVAAEKAAEAAKQKVDQATANVDRAELQKRIYQTYNYPDMLKQMEKATVKGELDLKKTHLKSKADIEDAANDLAVAKDQVKKIEAELAELREDMQNLVLVAPADGIVLYGSGDVRRSSSRPAPAVGVTVYRGTLMTIPQAGDYKINISIGEHARPRLKIGAEVMVTFQAVEGVSLRGRLVRISRYASRQRSWDSSSPRVFQGVVELEGTDERLTSGLTGNVRVIVDRIADCVAVPIESVFNDNGDVVCFVRTPSGPERRIIQPGQANDDFVQVLSGITAGEEIYVDNPLDVSERSEGQRSSPTSATGTSGNPAAGS